MLLSRFGALVAAAAVLALVLCAGCIVHDPLYCDENTPCTMIDRPFCDLEGIYPQSEGHGRTCIANPFDGGLPPMPDAGADGSVDGAVPMPDAGAICGNDALELGETCDGTALAGHDCTTIGEGFIGGTLACEASCARFDTTGCTAPAGCGDGLATGMEECDGADLAAATCVSRGFMGGGLDCTAGCVFDTSGCFACGNGMKESAGGEACDGMDFGGSTCTSLGFDGGALACSGACTFDFSGCTNCGNGLKEIGEPCDGSDFGGATCTTVGAFQEGTLACTATCAIDTAGCIACGDAVAEGSEQCDGADLNGNNCTTIGAGFIGGTLACNPATCAFDTSACTSPPNCPNGVINAGEDCDPPALGAGTCSSATGGALVSGGLTCNGACHYDTAACYTCGNTTVEGPETCDGANLAGATCFSRGHDGGTLACAAGCMGYTETACTDCGDGVAEGAEPCDGSDLDGATCTSVGPGTYSGGSLACNGTCSGYSTAGCNGPPTVPALRKPMNDAYMGTMFVPNSRRPIFQWDSSTVVGGTAVTYELQYGTDPTYSAATTVSTMTLTNFQPAADLPASALAPVGARYYWRVRACAGGACSAYSPGWRVNVGRSDKDFNGDGYADIVVGAYGISTAYVYFGSSAGVDSTADGILFTGAPGEALGWSVSSAGDVNADGFGDLVVGAQHNSAAGTDAGRAYVYFGGAGATFNTTIDGTLTGAAAQDYFGVSVASAGDVNNDGYADVIVGATGNDIVAPQAGAAYVYFGGAGAFDTTADLTLTDASGTGADYFGGDVGSAGDINGDGHADFVVGAQFSDAGGLNSGQVYLYFGGPGVDTVPDVLMPGAALEQFGYDVASAGDVDSDGYGDLIVGEWASDIGGMDIGRAFLYFGGVSFNSAADATIAGAAAGDYFGISVACAGDLNADGYSDIVVGASKNDFAAMDAGRAYVYFGGPGAFNITNDGAPAGTGLDDRYGFSARSAGDVDGDGDSDLIVGAAQNDGAGSNSGRAYVYFGAPGSSLNTVADVTLSGAMAGYFFGYSVD